MRRLGRLLRCGSGSVLWRVGRRAHQVLQVQATVGLHNDAGKEIAQCRFADRQGQRSTRWLCGVDASHSQRPPLQDVPILLRLQQECFLPFIGLRGGHRSQAYAHIVQGRIPLHRPLQAGFGLPHLHLPHKAGIRPAHSRAQPTLNIRCHRVQGKMPRCHPPLHLQRHDAQAAFVLQSPGIGLAGAQPGRQGQGGGPCARRCRCKVLQPHPHFRGRQRYALAEGGIVHQDNAAIEFHAAQHQRPGLHRWCGSGLRRRCGLRRAQPAIHHPLPTRIPLYPHTRLGQRHPPDLHRMACTIDTHILDLQALEVCQGAPIAQHAAHGLDLGTVCRDYAGQSGPIQPQSGHLGHPGAPVPGQPGIGFNHPREPGREPGTQIRGAPLQWQAAYRERGTPLLRRTRTRKSQGGRHNGLGRALLAFANQRGHRHAAGPLHGCRGWKGQG